jgi:hypothetical protein
MMLRVIIELKEIWCVFIERKMECRTSAAGHGRRQLGALWGWWLAAVVAGVHGGGSHVAPRRVGSGCRWQALARRRGESRRQWLPRHVGVGDGSQPPRTVGWQLGAVGPSLGCWGCGSGRGPRRRWRRRPVRLIGSPRLDLRLPRLLADEAAAGNPTTN